MRYVIIGGGIAGITAAETIRRIDPHGDIILVGDEPGLPYCRPMISLLLEGAIDAAQLPIRRADFFDRLAIKPLFGQRVSGIDVDGQSIQIGTDQTVAFDRLLIASGADPRPIKAEGLSLKNLFYMRTARQVEQMVRRLGDTRRALVLGGGLVGFKAAYGLLRRGVKVTMLIKSQYPLSLQVDEVAGGMIRDRLIEKGLDVRVGLEVRAFEGRKSVSAAIISDGTTLPCDLVVIGKGVLPALDFVPRHRIEVDLGVVVDDCLQTTAAGVYAAGDAAEHIDVSRRIRWVNAIWPEAVSQGRIAGMNMAARPVFYKGSLSRNVIRMFDLDVMAGGMIQPSGHDDQYRAYSLTDNHASFYRKLVFKDNLLVGFVLVNRVEQGGVLVSLIHHQIPISIPEGRLLDPSFNIKQLMPYTGRAQIHQRR